MSVVVENLTKSFGTMKAIDDLSVAFQEHSISVLLGPSGCGKTTVLRSIAGLEAPKSWHHNYSGESGVLRRTWGQRATGKASVGNGFSIICNLAAYDGLRKCSVAAPGRGIKRSEVRQRVAEVLAMVGLSEFSVRGATQLSGGQQQRVAIARCLVSRPALILLDEPFSNLDAKLRVDMRNELLSLQRTIRAMMIFVTHDQEEAMALADQIFLFRHGRLEQRGSPGELYMKPQTRYAAEFLGKANLFPVVIRVRGNGREIVTCELEHVIGMADDSHGPNGNAGALCLVRPETWQIMRSGGAGLPAVVESVVFLGDRTAIDVSTPIGLQHVVTLGHEQVQIGETLQLSATAGRIQLLPHNT